MPTETPKIPLSSLKAEQRAYRKLDKLIDDVEAEPKTSLAKDLKEKKESTDIYSGLMANWLGVEVASLYVAPVENGDPECQPIEFLYEAVPAAVDLPMFWVSAGENGDNNRLLATDVDEAEAKRRRETQDRKGRSSREQLTAQLCARHLRERDDTTQPHLILQCGEILAYCFLYRVLKEISTAGSGEKFSWQAIAQKAWNKLRQAHAKRPGSSINEVEVLLRSTLRKWYFLGIGKGVISLRSANIILSIYVLDGELGNMLEKVDDPTLSDNSTFALFLEQWAQAVYNGLGSTPSHADSDLEELFWQRTLINPDIEELLCTRGLYVTIIRSPFTQESQVSPLSEAYAICTLFDADRLESSSQWRTHLDIVLRRVGHEDLSKYEFQRLERQGQYQLGILDLLQAVSNPSIDSEKLMEKAAVLFQYVSDAERVLIAWSNVGLQMLGRGVHDDIKHGEAYPAIARREPNPFENMWFDYLSSAASEASRLANVLPECEGRILTLVAEGTSRSCLSILDRICEGLQIKHDKKYPVQTCLLGDRQGMVLLFSSSDDPPSVETGQQLQRIALTLGVGMELPFRNAIGRGLFSGILRCVCHPVASIRTIGSSFFGWCGHRRANPHRILNWFVASIVEFNRIGFVCVGILFSYLVFYILWHMMRGIGGSDTQERDIAHTLGNVERTVMAFSICLAATGVVFLLKPGMSVGQPKWMKRFAELGILEITLVRLAAMVLTIHVLKVALEANLAFEVEPTANRVKWWSAMQPTLFHVVVYLMILVGLAFLSKFLLGDDKKAKESDEEAAAE